PRDVREGPPGLLGDEPARGGVEVDRRRDEGGEVEPTGGEVRRLQPDRAPGEGGGAGPARGDPGAGADDPLRPCGHVTRRGVSGGVHHSPLFALIAPMMSMTVAMMITSGYARKPMSTIISTVEAMSPMAVTIWTLR